jgi:hypothetical protein
MDFDKLPERFHDEPTLWFFITKALVTALPGVLLIRFAVHRGRLSGPVKDVCAAGKFALM